MTQCCGTCKFFDSYFPDAKFDDQEDYVGGCEWLPEGGLPPTWKLARREVLATNPTKGADCPQYRAKQ